MGKCKRYEAIGGPVARVVLGLEGTFNEPCLRGPNDLGSLGSSIRARLATSSQTLSGVRRIESGPCYFEAQTYPSPTAGMLTEEA
jgi:hypothetical protein